MCVDSNNFSLLNVRQTWKQLRYDRKGKVTRKHLSSISIILMWTVLISFLLTPPQTIAGKQKAFTSRLGHKDLPLVNIKGIQSCDWFSRAEVN